MSEKKTNQKQTKEAKPKVINKIAGYDVKCNARTCMIFEDKFGYDMLLETASALEGNLHSVGFSGVLKMLYAMVCTANTEYLSEEKYNEFLESVSFEELNGDVFFETLSLAGINLKTEDEGK